MRTLLSTLRTKFAGSNLPPKRSIKTPGALYRILSAEFAQLRCGQCHCKMPMLVAIQRPRVASANWDVEPSWCASRSCQELLGRVVARNATLYDLQELHAPPAPDAADLGDCRSAPL